jgi:hypothetical protein
MAMSDAISHPTGLEIRFEREIAAAVPGWQSEIASLEPFTEARPPRPVVRRKFPRVRPHPRKVDRPKAAEG